MKKLIYSKEDLDLILTLELEEKDKEIERLNNKLKLINTIVEREFPPNEFITYKMKKILKGSDKE